MLDHDHILEAIAILALILASQIRAVSGWCCPGLIRR